MVYVCMFVSCFFARKIADLRLFYYLYTKIDKNITIFKIIVLQKLNAENRHFLQELDAEGEITLLLLTYCF